MSKFEQSFERAIAATKRPRKKSAKDVAIAIRTPAGVLVKNTPVHDPDELKWKPTLEKGRLGDLKIRQPKARVWFDYDTQIVSVEWSTGSGDWGVVSRYRLDESSKSKKWTVAHLGSEMQRVQTVGSYHSKAEAEKAADRLRKQAAANGWRLYFEPEEIR